MYHDGFLKIALIFQHEINQIIVQKGVWSDYRRWLW